MPNIKSAMKRVRTSLKARARNKAVKTEISWVRRRLFETVDGKDANAARQAFQIYCSVLDKAAKHGIVKKNTAIRRKRRAAAKLTTLTPAQPAAAN